MDDQEKINDGYADRVANSLKAKSKMDKNKSTAKTNKVWMWFGVIVLIAILLWWLFSIGIFDAIVGTTNG